MLGPRQTGKSSCLNRLRWDLEISFLVQRTRLEYEKDPDRLIKEVEAIKIKSPRILIDEVQKVPAIMDVVQYLVDKRKAIFALTGSSARKLKTKNVVNLLPGRIVLLRMDPLSLLEFDSVPLEDLLLFGSLPEIILTEGREDREIDLESYSTTFLDEEVRKEALVRNVPAFARFIELAAIDSGNISNLSEISKHVGVAHTTIAQHYQILEDCLLIERFEPISQSLTRRKLTRSPRYVMFDLGMRRLAANEGPRLNPERLGQLFEQYVGLELRRELRSLGTTGTDICFWRDPDGPEVDWVLKTNDEWIPIEVKLTTSPKQSDAKHLEVFMDEYDKKARRAFIVCRVQVAQQITPRVKAIPWKDLPKIVKSII